jgi:hypothetical protein
MDSGKGIATVLVVLLILVVAFMILREFFCWYWKINERIAILNDIKKLLHDQGKVQTRGISEPTPISEKLLDVDQGDKIILGGKKYLRIDEGKGDAFCSVCRTSSPMIGMFKLENSDYYYHHDCLIKRVDV